ncbi:MAG: hypothetical protein JW741_23015 [Sedimentisphaerales bacterium]|nr:hypothetical protein [Sedimentisphaerales bacterium]
MILVLVFVGCHSHLFAQSWPFLPDSNGIPEPENIVIGGQGGYIFFNVSGSEGTLDPVLGEGAQKNGDAGLIRIQTGIEVDEGNGSDGDLTESITLEPGEYHYRYVGIPDGILTPGTLPLVITIKGRVVIRCQHNFYARIKGDYSLGVPQLEVYMGTPEPIDCQVDGRTIGLSELPFLVVGELTSEEGDDLRDGGTFIFHSEYEGDLKVALFAVAGEAALPGSIHMDAHKGDVRGMAAALAMPSDARSFDPTAAGEILISASSDGQTESEILGEFTVSVQYEQNPMMPFDPPIVVLNPGGNIELNADKVTNLTDAFYSFTFESAPLPGVRKEDLVRYLPERAMSGGIYVSDVQATGGSSQPGGAIEIKTGTYVDTGIGAEAVTTDRTLPAGTYHFEYVHSPEDQNQVTLTVTGDVVIYCQYLFAAKVRAAEDLAEAPDVVVYAGPPVVPEDDADPVPLYFSQHSYMGPYHYANVNLTGRRTLPEDGTGSVVIPWPVLPGEYDHINSPGGIFLFHTTAFGSIEARHLDASAGPPDPQDIVSLYGPAAAGGEVILLAQQGDITVNSVHADGGGGMLEGGHGGRVMMRGDNIFISDGVSSSAAGMNGDGGQIYIEALNYSSGEEGQVGCADRDGPVIYAHGTGQIAFGGIVVLPGRGGDVTVIPNTLGLGAISVQGAPVGTIDEWLPDDLAELQYE